MRRDPGIAYDGFQTITEGINSGVPASLLPRTQFAWAKNLTFRGYFPKTRPGWILRPLQFLDSSGAVDNNLQTGFEDYIFQGAAAFEKLNQLVVAVGGRLFRIRVDLWDVMDITTPDVNNAQNYRNWFCEAESFMIVQDNNSAPWIYDGALTRRSDTFGIYGDKEVPVGNAMCYSQGRLVVALPDARSFVIGDIVGGPSGTASYNFKDAVLKFTENTLINGGGSFTIPISAGEIRAIRPVAQVDTSTGQGPTQVFTTNAVFSVNTPSARDQWAVVNYPIQTFSLVNNGSLSDRATILVNGDIWMRAMDGVRSFVVARRDFGTWVNAPVSREVTRAMEDDVQDLLLYASGAAFDNRFFMTTRPYVNFEHGVVFDALTVVDFSPISYLGAAPRPVWEGIWTGLRFLQVISGTFFGAERCFAFALDSNNNVTLWEMTRDQVNDNDGTTNEREIQWALETSSFAFKDSGFDLKRLRKGYLWLSELDGEVDIEVLYRANEDPCWHLWTSWSLCATTETCGSGNCVTPLNLHLQYRRPYILPEPSGECDATVGVPDSVGEEFQVRLQGGGHLAFSRFLIAASDEQQDVNSLCPQVESCQTVSCCGFFDYDYFIN